MHGIGLFATKRIKKKDIICLYSGDIVSEMHAETTKSNYLVEIGVGKRTLFIDGQNTKNFSGRWINHHFQPNARLVQPAGGIFWISSTRCAIIVECIQEIQNDGEIFIDYGEKYFTHAGVLDYKAYTYGM